VSLLRELEKLLQEVTEQQQPARPRPRRIGEIVEPADAEIVLAEPVDQRGSVAEHVAEHLDTSDISRHVSSLGADVGQADDRLEARIHEKFDRDLSKLDDRFEESAGADQQSKTEESMAAEIAQLFRTPQSVRQAIVLNEILQRPEDRW
jgi:hypothetical protein